MPEKEYKQAEEVVAKGGYITDFLTNRKIIEVFGEFKKKHELNF